MTSLTLEMPPSLQRLVNERLDAIDRVLLLSGLPRPERQAAVAEVDSQIHEMLAQRAPAGPERHDLLAVLSQLDPPEAFLSEESAAAQLGPAAVSPQRKQLQPQPSVLALCSAVAGLIGGLSIVGVIVGYLYDSEAVALLSGMIALLMGILATIGGVVSIFRIRESKGFEFGLPLAVFATLFLPLALLDLAQLFVVQLFSELGIFLSLGFNILLTNGVVIYAAWRFLASRINKAA